MAEIVIWKGWNQLAAVHLICKLKTNYSVALEINQQRTCLASVDAQGIDVRVGDQHNNAAVNVRVLANDGLVKREGDHNRGALVEGCRCRHVHVDTGNCKSRLASHDSEGYMRPGAPQQGRATLQLLVMIRQTNKMHLTHARAKRNMSHRERYIMTEET